MNTPLWTIWDSTPCTEKGVVPANPGLHDICGDCPIREFCMHVAGGPK